MNATSSTLFPDAFIVSEEQLKKIHKLFADRIGPVKISADCTDGMTRRFDTVTELMTYENVKSKQIERLYLSARSSDYTKEASLNLPSSSFGRFILEINAREDVVSNLREKTTEIIEGMIPWYSRLHRIDFTKVAIYGYALLVFTAILLVSFGWIPVGETLEDGTREAALNDLFGLAAIIIILVVATSLNRLRDYAFPRGVFLIGQGKTRYEFLVQVQWVIIIGFFVSLAAGIPFLMW